MNKTLIDANKKKNPKTQFNIKHMPTQVHKQCAYSCEEKRNLGEAG